MIGSAKRALLLAAHAAHREVAHRAAAAPTQRTAPNSGLRLSNAPPAPPTRDRSTGYFAGGFMIGSAKRAGAFH